MTIKEMRHKEKEIEDESIDFKIGFYRGVLGGTNDPKIPKEADLKLRALLRKKNRGKVKV